MGHQPGRTHLRPATPVDLPPKRMLPAPLPPLWSQLAPTEQRQLAQLVAALIWRAYCPPHPMEEHHEQPSPP